MEVSYKRFLNESYMIIEYEGENKEGVEIGMLSHNEVPGLLPQKREIYDGGCRYWYDITGKQSFEDYMRRRSADGKILKMIFCQLDKICGDLKNYMLEEDSLLLHSEFVYLNFEKDSLFLAYLPEKQVSLKEEFRQLMEQVLQRIDHGDKEAVNLGYEMYQYSLQEELPFSEILMRALNRRPDESKEDIWKTGTEEERMFETTLNEKQYRGAEPAEPEKMQVRKKEEQDKKYKEPGNCKQKFRPDNIQLDMMQKKEKGRNKQIKWSVSKYIWNKLESLWSKGDRKEKKESPLSRHLKKEKHVGWKLWGKIQENESVRVYESPQDDEAEIIHPTEYLGGSGGMSGRLMYQGEDAQPDFMLSQPSFLIGKERSEVDGAITERSVSRIHARVEHEEDSYYIEDLNSTNGTFVNGKQMEYREKVRLSPGDRVTFGTVEYLFL